MPHLPLSPQGDTSSLPLSHTKAATGHTISQEFIAALLLPSTAPIAAVCPFLQVILMFIAVAILAALSGKLILKASICLLNRTQRSCRHALLASSIVDDAGSTHRTEIDSLRADFEATQRHERDLIERYSQSRCAAEDVIRATSLRLLAEIQLLRHEKMPKSWADKCAAHIASTTCIASEFPRKMFAPPNELKITTD